MEEAATTLSGTTSKLAIDGGQPWRSRPFAPWPCFEPDEIEAAMAVLRSGRVNYWTGDEGRQFEQEFAAYAGVKHAIAVANGTVGLELALYALGIGPGDEVITTCRTFIASASCAAMRGARPVMADVHSRQPERHGGYDSPGDYGRGPRRSLLFTSRAGPATWIPSCDWRANTI